MDPFELPPVAPKVLDFQRSRVVAAEESAARKAVSPLVTEQSLESACNHVSDLVGRGLSPTVVSGEDTVRYWRDEGRIEVGEDARMPRALHAVAHHIVDPVFPAHGIEYVTAFLMLLERHCGAGIAAVYREEFDSRKVHRSVERRIARVRRDAVWYTKRVPGLLTKLIVDDPPESVICRLYGVTKTALKVSDDRGDRDLPLERVRYIATAPFENALATAA